LIVVGGAKFSRADDDCIDIAFGAGTGDGSNLF
jgi:hypothetical protein